VSLTETPEPAHVAADKIPISLNQEFVCLFDHGDGHDPFDPRYHIVQGWRLAGQIGLDALRKALTDVVTRHEALRTLIVRGDGGRYQRILPPSQPELEIRDLAAEPRASRDQRAEALLQQVEAETISAERVPFVRAVLGRFDDQDAVLVLIVHHIATDGWSMRVLIRDLVNRYAAHRGFAVPELPEVRQYREFSLWQRQGSAAQDASRKFWRAKLDGARLTAIPTDLARSAELTQSTAAYRFLIPASVMSLVSRMVTVSRSTPFMVMLAAYELVVHEMTGATDLVVPTFTPGRGGSLFENSIGSFFNFIPLRTDIAGCQTFRDVLERTRRACLEAYAHDIPTIHIFAEAPGLMLPAMSDRAAPVVFQVFPDPNLLSDQFPGDLKYVEITRRLTSQPLTSAVPDGGLWTLNLDPSGDVIGSLSYQRNLFYETTISRMVKAFQQRLASAVSSPGAPLGLTRWA
jgi:condensation enzyme